MEMTSELTGVTNPPGAIPSFAEILGEATLAFLQHGSLKQMAGILVKGACRISGAEAGWILEPDETNRTRMLARHPERFGPAGLRTALTSTVTWGELIHSQSSRLVHSGLPKGITCLLGAPCLTGDGLIAVLALVNHPDGFDTDLQTAITGFADTIALALHSARTQLNHQKTLDELRQAQKMEALGRLAAGIAHDFNNLLTVISGYGSLLAHELPPESQAREDLDSVLEASQRASDLSRQLLAFSRRQMLRPEVLDLNVQIRRLHKLVSRVISANITIQLELGQNLPPVMADPGQIEQILMNLVVNACDAMPAGGQITVRSGHRIFDQFFLDHHKGSRRGNYSWFSVHDSGTGIAAKFVEKIFLPFYTTKDQGKGTGLGLATVYGIVKQSKGYITVESSPDHGTCFTVFLPRARRSPLTPSRPKALPNHLRRGLVVLVVEDDTEVLDFIVRVLNQQGFRVLATNDPESAVDLCTGHHEPLDMLITDMVMPTLSGPVLAGRLRELQPALPVLFLSGYGHVTFRHDFTSGEPGLFLAKPFSPEQLLEAIGQGLASAATPAGGES